MFNKSEHFSIISLGMFCFNDIYSLSVNVWRQFPNRFPISITIPIPFPIGIISLAALVAVAALLDLGQHAIDAFRQNLD